MQNTAKPRRRRLLWVLLGVALALALIFGIHTLRTSRRGITRYVVSHQQELETFAMESRETSYKHWRVRRSGPGTAHTEAIEFSVASFGLVPSGHERGFARLPDGPETGLIEGVTLTRTGDGWRWQENYGDNGGTIVPIVGNWYCFEWHW